MSKFHSPSWESLFKTVEEYNQICPQGYKLHIRTDGMYSAALYCQYGRKVMGFTDPGTLTGELHEAIQSIYKKKELASFKPAIRELYKLCDVNKDGFLELVKSAIAE